MMGDALVEQKRLQKPEDPKTSAAIERAKRRNERKEGRASMAEQVAFMGRRKLIKAIMGAK